MLAIGLLDEVADGNGQDEEPVGSHDEHFVEAEAQADVEHHVEGEEREGEPQESAAAATPDADEEERGEDGLDDVADGPSIVHDDGPRAQCVLQQVVGV